MTTPLLEALMNRMILVFANVIADMKKLAFFLSDGLHERLSSLIVRPALPRDDLPCVVVPKADIIRDPYPALQRRSERGC